MGGWVGGTEKEEEEEEEEDVPHSAGCSPHGPGNRAGTDSP